MLKVYEGMLDAGGSHFAIVVSRFNELITAKLLAGALDCLKRHGCGEEDIEVAWVPGAFELPQHDARDRHSEPEGSMSEVRPHNQACGRCRT